jgi:hypothetical protein
MRAYAQNTLIRLRSSCLCDEGGLAATYITLERFALVDGEDENNILARLKGVDDLFDVLQLGYPDTLVEYVKFRFLLGVRMRTLLTSR